MVLPLRRDAADRRLRAMRDRRVLVVGDLMLDRYVYGTVDRISPEAPVPVVRVIRESHMLGGAGNVAANLRAMGACVAVAGFVGVDEEGDELLALLRQMEVDARRVRRIKDAPTTVKTRIVAERQQIVRVDYDGRPSLPKANWDRFCTHVAEAADKADGIVLADYGKGALDQRIVDAVLGVAEERRIPSGLDPKNPALHVRGVTVVTPNRKEAFQIARMTDPGAAPAPMEDAPLREAARRLLRHWGAHHVLVTLGPQGMLIAPRGGSFIHVPTRAREVFDVSGAGDTVIAVCVLALAAGADMVEAAEIANYAAGIVVGKMGTATCSPEELLRSLAEEQT